MSSFFPPVFDNINGVQRLREWSLMAVRCLQTADWNISASEDAGGVRSSSVASLSLLFIISEEADWLRRLGCVRPSHRMHTQTNSLQSSKLVTIEMIAASEMLLLCWKLEFEQDSGIILLFSWCFSLMYKVSTSRLDRVGWCRLDYSTSVHTHTQWLYDGSGTLTGGDKLKMLSFGSCQDPSMGFQR